MSDMDVVLQDIDKIYVSVYKMGVGAGLVMGLVICLFIFACYQCFSDVVDFFIEKIRISKRGESEKVECDDVD